MTAPRGIGSEIQSLRRRARMTQRELAQRTGIAQPNIAAYESGRRTPNGETLARIRRVVGPRPSESLAHQHVRAAEIVRNHRGRRSWVFGSVARGEDGPSSDLDLLVEFEPGATLLDEASLEQELERLLGIDVDVVSVNGLRGAVGDEIRESARPWFPSEAAS